MLDSVIDVLIEKQLITEDEIEAVFKKKLEELRQEIEDLKSEVIVGNYFGPAGEA